jgi:hypothetical protein
MRYIRKIATFGLLALLVTVSITQPTEGQEIGWKTYHNYKHQWSIKYPMDWRVIEVIPSNLIRFIDSAVVDVSVQEGVSSLEEFIIISEQTWKEMYREYTRISMEKTTLGGEPAMEIIATYTYREEPSILFKKSVRLTVKEGVGYLVNGYTSRYAYNVVNQKYFEPMMESFKFEVPQKTPLESLMESLRDSPSKLS